MRTTNKARGARWWLAVAVDLGIVLAFGIWHELARYPRPDLLGFLNVGRNGVTRLLLRWHRARQSS